jgi:glycosyltransferase involved in cell wall biosynthesis
MAITNNSAETDLLSATAIARNQDNLISICVIVPNDISRLKTFIADATNSLNQAFEYYELLLIDNGTPAESHQAIQEIQRQIPNVRMLRLSRENSLETAIGAALDHCIGDYVVIMNPAEHPLSLVPAMVARAITGYDVVIAERLAPPPSALERLITHPAYRLASRVMGFSLKPDESYFRVFSRRCVNALIRIRSKNRSLSYMNALIGLRRSVVSYAAESEIPAQSALRRLFRQLVAVTSIVVSNSGVPLRFAALLGLLASILNLIYLVYILVVTMVKSKIAEGWLTTSLMHTVMFLFLFLIMAILAEYIGRILNESKEQPLYFIESESNSTVSAANRERLNIV